MRNKTFAGVAVLIVSGLAMAMAIPTAAPLLPAVYAVSSSGCEHAADGLNDNNGAGFNPNCVFEPPVPNCKSDQGFPCRERPFK